MSNLQPTSSLPPTPELRTRWDSAAHDLASLVDNLFKKEALASLQLDTARRELELWKQSYSKPQSTSCSRPARMLPPMQARQRTHPEQ